MTHDRLDIYIEIAFWASKSHGRNPLYSCNLDFLFFVFFSPLEKCLAMYVAQSSALQELSLQVCGTMPGHNQGLSALVVFFFFLTKVTFLSLIIYPIH